MKFGKLLTVQQLALKPLKRPEVEQALLPVRHPQPSLFLCDISDALIKDDMASMEHPIFALQTGDMNTRRYQNGDNYFQIEPSQKGLPSITDKDVLIYAISKLMAAKERGQPIQKEIKFHAKDYMVFTNRHTTGKYYDQLKDSLTRLAGSLLTTSIKTGKETTDHMFHLVESATIKRTSLDGRVVEWGITLSDWLMRAIEANEVLTLNADYFRLRRPLERRIYEIARKHCGHQASWKISVDKLYLKSGSRDRKRRFRTQISELANVGHLPDYDVLLEDGMVTFLNQNHQAILKKQLVGLPSLRSETFEEAREIAEGWDVYVIFGEWNQWMADQGKEAPKRPDAAFMGFVAKWVARRGPARGF